MGAKQSKRSVDITTTPKKDDGELVEGGGKVEKIGDTDVKVTNGDIHKEVETPVSNFFFLFFFVYKHF